MKFKAIWSLAAILNTLFLFHLQAARTIEEGLKVEVDYKNLYNIYNNPFPSMLDTDVSINIKFFEDSTGNNTNGPFKNQNGLLFVADQNNLQNLGITSPWDLYQNYPNEFAQYNVLPFSTDGGAAWSSSATSAAELALFFVIPVTSGSDTTLYVTEIFYLEIVDYHAEQESWSVGAGWDGQTPFVFTSVTRRFVEFDGGPANGGTIEGKENWGNDVIDATTPRNRSSLQILIPDNNNPNGFTVKKLFPLPTHAGIVDDQIGHGSVTEPNISLDGNWVIFTYFHDVLNNFTSSNSGSLLLKGADLYCMNISQIKNDPSIDPATIPIHRLTQTLLDTTGKEHDLDDKNKDAMNPSLAKYDFNFNFRYGVVYMHGIEVMTEKGPRLVFVSSIRRLGNSNNNMGRPNYNLNLFEAEIDYDSGLLTNINQIHYYTTTSALSPANMRDGFCFSYQSTTEEARSWEVQVSKSNYQWSPGIGYGINSAMALHLQTLCSTMSKDWLVTGFYYNGNNNGFGTIVANPADQLGKNIEYYSGSDYTFGSSWGMLPRQAGVYNIIQGGIGNDYPSSIGKFTTPRAGRENEIFLSYSPFSSNSKSYDSDGNKGRYDSYCVALPNVDGKLNGSQQWNVSELLTVLNDNSKFKSQLWHTPILTHEDRFNEAPVTSSLEKAVEKVAYYQNDPNKIHGQPYSVVGTSALSNTDGKTKDKRLAVRGKKYILDQLSNNEWVTIQKNIVGLSKVVTNENGFPDINASVRHDHILGVAVNLTSNKPDQNYNMGYETASGQQELSKLLGVYDVRTAPDDSFLATIPSNQSFELHLIEREYGLKLLDQRSWKSLKAGEVRNNCGGCHNHVDAPIPFSGTHADNPFYTPEDMVTKTKYIEYDANCVPKETLSEITSPTLSIPEYYTDILPGLQQHCASCHSNGETAAHIFNLDNSEQAYKDFSNKKFYNADGALGSPLFWAARGQRTDNRDNNDPEIQNSNFKYSTIHDTIGPNGQGLCDGTDVQLANFVYQLGLWIDHLMPKDRQSNPPYSPDFDRFHPSVNFDLALINNDLSNKDPNSLIVSYWDDTNFDDGGEMLIYVNDALVYNNNTILSNGSTTLDTSSWSLQETDIIEAIIIDSSDNHQYYKKSFGELSSQNNGGGNPRNIDILSEKKSTKKFRRLEKSKR